MVNDNGSLFQKVSSILEASWISRGKPGKSPALAHHCSTTLGFHWEACRDIALEQLEPATVPGGYGTMGMGTDSRVHGDGEWRINGS